LYIGTSQQKCPYPHIQQTHNSHFLTQHLSSLTVTIILSTMLNSVVKRITTSPSPNLYTLTQNLHTHLPREFCSLIYTHLLDPATILVLARSARPSLDRYPSHTSTLLDNQIPAYIRPGFLFPPVANELIHRFFETYTELGVAEPHEISAFQTQDFFRMDGQYTTVRGCHIKRLSVSGTMEQWNPSSTYLPTRILVPTAHEALRQQHWAEDAVLNVHIHTTERSYRYSSRLPHTWNGVVNLAERLTSIQVRHRRVLRMLKERGVDVNMHLHLGDRVEWFVELSEWRGRAGRVWVAALCERLGVEVREEDVEVNADNGGMRVPIWNGHAGIAYTIYNSTSAYRTPTHTQARDPAPTVPLAQVWQFVKSCFRYLRRVFWGQ
jgi:hypothetical protein